MCHGVTFRVSSMGVKTINQSSTKYLVIQLHDKVALQLFSFMYSLLSKKTVYSNGTA